MLRSVSAATALCAVLPSCVVDTPEHDWEGLITQAYSLQEELGPAPDDRFECPYVDMKYNLVEGTYCDEHQPNEDDNELHFDCDDFSFTCAIWGQAHAIRTCQVSIGGYTNRPVREERCQVCDRVVKSGGESFSAHALNLVEYADEDCVVEPQWKAPGNRLACWPKRKSITSIPRASVLRVCEKLGFLGDERCELREAFCELRQTRRAGEAAFTTRPKICDALTSCGFDARAFLLPPPPPLQASAAGGE